MNELRRSAVSASAWQGFAASIPGAGHIRRGIPCQDASLVLVSPRPALIVCDGRGSASRSELGAQGAVAAFKRQIAILEPFLSHVLDKKETSPEQWDKFCRILYRTLHQVQLDLAAEHGVEPKEFDFTAAWAIVGTHHIGCFQVGDGSIVLRQRGECRSVFPPEKGEFANQTHFLRPGGEAHSAFQQTLFPAAENSGIAITSDGPEHMMFRLSDMKPGPVFDCFFDDLGKGEFLRQDLMDYLTGREWNDDPRGADDRSVALLIPPAGSCTVPAGEDAKIAADAAEVAPAAPAKEEDAAADTVQNEEDTAADAPAGSPAPAKEENRVADTEEPAEPVVSPVPMEPPLPGSPAPLGTAMLMARVLLAASLAAAAIAGVGYGRDQHRRLVAVERSHEKVVRELQESLACRAAENRRLGEELRQLREARSPSPQNGDADGERHAAEPGKEVKAP